MVVLLDNGHGENTIGKGSPYALNGVNPPIYLKEWQYCRWIAAEVERRLKLRGVDVRRIVRESNDVSLPVRVNRVNEVCNREGKGNVLLVSIHINASGDGKKWMSPNYWSVWTTRGTTVSDGYAKIFSNVARSTFFGKNVKNPQESDFYILKYTKCAALLTENFFQDSIEGCKYLLSSEGMNKVVDCHVKAILECIK